MKIFSLSLFAVISLLGFSQTLIYLLLRKKFDSWPVVTAEVTHSRLLNQLAPDGEDMLEAIIHFKYSFRGKEYKSDTPFLRSYDLFPSYGYEMSLVKKYTKGNIYNLRVNPRVPEIAHFEVSPLSKLSAILAPLMALGGILLSVLYFYFFYNMNWI